MIDILFTTLALVGGISLGGIVSEKYFGSLKNRWLYFVEVFGVIILVVIALGSIERGIETILASVLIFLLIGFSTVVFVRGILTGLGLLSERMKRDVFKEKDKIDYIIGMKKALERRGFEEKEIKRIAEESGFKKKDVVRVFDFFK